MAEEFVREEREALKYGGFRRLFNELYPLYGGIALEEMDAPFDVVVIDEAQDLVDWQTLDFLNYAMRGGFAGGRWAIFGDFTRQALYGDTLNPIEVLSQYSEHFVRATLTLNCRNSRRIAEETTILSGFDKSPFRLGEELGLPVEHRYWKTRSDLMASLKIVLERLVNENIPISNVVLLSQRRLENSSLAGIEKISRYSLVDCSQDVVGAGPSDLKYSTIHSFKGLESQVVIVVDINTVEGEKPQSLLYVAMSRARSLLILMINEHARNAVQSRIRQAMEQKLH